MAKQFGSFTEGARQGNDPTITVAELAARYLERTANKKGLDPVKKRRPRDDAGNELWNTSESEEPIKLSLGTQLLEAAQRIREMALPDLDLINGYEEVVRLSNNIATNVIADRDCPIPPLATTIEVAISGAAAHLSSDDVRAHFSRKLDVQFAALMPRTSRAPGS